MKNKRYIIHAVGTTKSGLQQCWNKNKAGYTYNLEKLAEKLVKAL